MSALGIVHFNYITSFHFLMVMTVQDPELMYESLAYVHWMITVKFDA